MDTGMSHGTGGARDSVVESLPHIVWTAAPDGAVTYVNRRGEEYCGRARETLYGWEYVAVVHPGDAERARGTWQAAARTGKEYYDEYRVRRSDGVYRWSAVRASPVRDVAGEVYQWAGTVTDIEDQRQLELSLRSSEAESRQSLALLEALEDSLPVGIKLVGRDLRILRANRALARASGIPAEELLGRTVAEALPEVWPKVAEAYGRALKGEVVSNVEHTAVNKEDGRLHDLLGSYYPVRVGGELIAVGNTLVDVTELKKAHKTVERNLAALVDTIATTVEYRDPYTAGHQRRVAAIAGAIAAEIGLGPSDAQGIRIAASIHDIGKISVPAEILSKPSNLSPAECQLIREHSEAGYQIIAGIDFPWPVAEMVRQHHERLNGSGYPRRLRGKQISLGARIIAVADTVEAMSAHRPYRPSRGVEAALEQIQHDRGTLLDPECVDACIRLFRGGGLHLD